MLKIFYINLADWDLIDQDLDSLVNPDFYEMVKSCRSGKVRLTKILGEAMTRYLLMRFGDREKNHFIIHRGEHGKPYVANADQLYFNISHSGNYIVCAFSDSDVGVDVEKIATARMNVAGRFFHPEEVRRLEMVTGEEQNDLFFSYWAVKESFLKYIGTGLSRPLSSFEVKFKDLGIFLYEDKTSLPLYVKPCLFDTGYKCYVCSEQDIVPEVIRLVDFTL